ncbi:hypothetical protein MPSEU_000689800 [Mayamaea pseudoterrestris]|nr:hypothetical protein MPSEU_000689800 [Mayamaea pseudoterrestris]
MIMKPFIAFALWMLPVSGQEQTINQENPERILCDCDEDLALGTGSASGVHPTAPPETENDLVPTFSGAMTAFPTPTSLAALNNGNYVPSPSITATAPPVIPTQSPVTSAPTVFVVGDRNFLPTLSPTSMPVAAATSSPVSNAAPVVSSPVTSPGAANPAPIPLPTLPPVRPPTPSPVAASQTPRPTPRPVAAAPVQIPTARPPTRRPTPAPVARVTPAPVRVVTRAPVPVPAPVSLTTPNDDCFDDGCFDFISPRDTGDQSAAAAAASNPTQNLEAQSSGLGAAPLVGMAVGGLLIIVGVVVAGRNRYASKERRRMAAANADSMEHEEDVFEPDSPMSAHDSLSKDQTSPQERFQDA